MDSSCEYLGEYKIDSFFATLLGIFVANNIIYITKIGNTYINIVHFYSVFLFLYIIFKDKNAINSIVKYFSKTLLIYLIVIMCSSFTVLLIFKGDYFSRYINGILLLFMNLTIYMNILYYKKYYIYVIKGVFYGVLINIIFCFVQYGLYLSGIVFTLDKLFPQPSFSIPRYGQFNLQGLFLEPSHFMGYIICTGILSAFFINNKRFRQVIFTMSLIIVVILTNSANMVLFGGLLFIFFIILRKRIIRKYEIKIKNLLIFLLIAIFITLIFYFRYEEILQIIHNIDLPNKLKKGFNDFNIMNVTNKERLENISHGFDILLKYPLGVGYNMETTIYEIEFENLINNASYSFFISNQLELGIMGTVIFFIFTISIFIRLFRSYKIYNKVLAISLLGTTIFMWGNGVRFPSYIWIIYGLSSIEYYHLKNTKEKECVM